MIGAVGPVSPVYGSFYQAVRQSNLQRRGDHKIRLLLGDPYGDWEKIQTREDLGPYLAHRDEWYAEVVSRRIAEKLGFSPEGIQRGANVLPGGKYADRHC